MTAWNDRTLEQQTAYVRKTYSHSPIRTLEGRIVHEQTPKDVEYAEAQFDQWLAAVTQPLNKTPEKGNR